MNVDRTSKKVVPARHPAAFINAVSEEGTKAEAVEWLQRTWDDLVDEKAKTERLERELAEANSHGPDGRNVTNAQFVALRAERDALRAALVEVRSASDGLRDDVRRRIERIEWITEEALERPAVSVSTPFRRVNMLGSDQIEALARAQGVFERRDGDTVYTTGPICLGSGESASDNGTAQRREGETSERPAGVRTNADSGSPPSFCQCWPKAPEGFPPNPGCPVHGAANQTGGGQ